MLLYFSTIVNLSCLTFKRLNRNLITFFYVGYCEIYYSFQIIRRYNIIQFMILIKDLCVILDGSEGFTFYKYFFMSQFFIIIFYFCTYN